MPSKLSFHFDSPYIDPWMVDHVNRSGVDLIKIVDPDHGTRPNVGAHVRIVGRFTFNQQMDHRWVEQGEVGARAWFEAVKPRLAVAHWVSIVETVNEYGLNRDGPDGRLDLAAEIEAAKRLAAFENECTRLLLSWGKESCIYNLATGNPRTMELWRILRCAKGHYLGQHEYGIRRMDPDCGDGHLMRHQWVDVYYREIGLEMPPVLIGETGIDVGGGPTTDGWQKHASEEQYLEQLAATDRAYQASPKVKKAFVFSWVARWWPSFRMRQSMSERFTGYVAAQNQAVAGPLPEQETAQDLATLCEKARYWTEEMQRQFEAGNLARADAIRRSLIVLLYRAERKAKQMGA